MIFAETSVIGAFVIDVDPHYDDRGFFARTWCQKEFDARGLNPRLVQCSISVNPKKGTWRGMHYQEAPHEEAKLVRCTMGSICDVIVDLRQDSPTFRQHLTCTLSATNRRMLYVPERCAHGFITLEDDAEVLYQMAEFHSPDSLRGFRWDDPYFGITLPIPVAVMSERDRNYPDFQPHA